MLLWVVLLLLGLHDIQRHNKYAVDDGRYPDSDAEDVDTREQELV